MGTILLSVLTLSITLSIGSYMNLASLLRELGMNEDNAVREKDF